NPQRQDYIEGLPYGEINKLRVKPAMTDFETAPAKCPTNPARMNIALPIQTILCCPKHYGAVSGG
ncbi:MAG: hypothetical protein LBU70_01870, partial [Chitinispirillales bacterium]|nr:hypothetical protein [Chitinispirillales bacterium]